MEKNKNDTDKKTSHSNAVMQTDSTGKENNSSISSVACLTIISLCVLIASIVIGFVIYNINNLNRLEPVKYNDIIENVHANKWYYSKESKAYFFQNKSLNKLKEIALNEEEAFSTIVEENSIESAGEAVPVGHVDCRHPFMTLNLNRTMCHFSNRLDVGMHFVKTGGFNGYIEYFERMVARIIPFRKRLSKQLLNSLNIDELNDQSYLNKLKQICGENLNSIHSKVDLDDIKTEMFQFDILLMLPGQELPMHLNVPYFWGADRSTLPQWLLVAMKRSGLFDHLFIPQVQSFLFFNLDDAESDDDQLEYEFVDVNGAGGDFYLYPYVDKPYTNKYVILKSKQNSPIMLDGSQIIHGVDRFKPDQMPPLFASHNHHYKIKYNSADSKWYLNDSNERLIRTYDRNEVRLMAVWNSHCFRNEQESSKFNSKSSNEISLNEVENAFKNELRSKDRLPSEQIEPLELWTIVIKDYLKYPINIRNQYSTLFGFNYCLLHNILPNWITDNLLKNLFKNC